MAGSEVLLINPRRRRKSGSAKRRRNPGRSPAQRRATAALVARNRRLSNPRRRRRRNPAVASVPYVAVATNPRRRRRSARRANPALRAYRRRRSNPALPRVGTAISMIQDAAIMGAGAVAMDYGYAKISGYLPQSMQVIPGSPGIGDAAKAFLTAMAGLALSRFTKGYSRKAATGALTVQAHGLVTNLMPATMMAGLGYVTPGRVVNYDPRVSLNRMGAYTRPGVSPIARMNVGVGRYTQPGVSPMVRTGLGIVSARAREGYAR